MSQPQFPDPLGRRELLSPGATAHKAGLSLEDRVKALEQGALGRPGPGVTTGSVPTSDTTQTGGVKWSPWLSTAWTEVSYATAWSSHGSTYGPPKYAKTRDGMVMLRGLVVKAAGSGTNVMFTLPAGARPPIIQVFACACDMPSGYGNVYAHVYVNPDGNVTMASYITSGSGVGTIGSANAVNWLSLNGIQFDTTA
jgi:hypothetical protein